MDGWNNITSIKKKITPSHKIDEYILYSICLYMYNMYVPYRVNICQYIHTIYLVFSLISVSTASQVQT